MVKYNATGKLLWMNPVLYLREKHFSILHAAIVAFLLLSKTGFSPPYRSHQLVHPFYSE